MAILQINLQTIDVGLATGQASNIIRVCSWNLGAVTQTDCILNVPQATANADAAQQMRDHLTANGKSWASENPLNIIS